MKKQEISQETIVKIENYIAQHFGKTFYKKPIIIVEKENHFQVSNHKDSGPIILSKAILEK
mgnify:FL=1